LQHVEEQRKLEVRLIYSYVNQQMSSATPHSVAMTCHMVGMSPWAEFYRWLSESAIPDMDLRDQIQRITLEFPLLRLAADRRAAMSGLAGKSQTVRRDYAAGQPGALVAARITQLGWISAGHGDYCMRFNFRGVSYAPPHWSRDVARLVL
jgi:hypothetical protein